MKTRCYKGVCLCYVLLLLLFRTGFPNVDFGAKVTIVMDRHSYSVAMKWKDGYLDLRNASYTDTLCDSKIYGNKLMFGYEM